MKSLCVSENSRELTYPVCLIPLEETQKLEMELSTVVPLALAGGLIYAVCRCLYRTEQDRKKKYLGYEIIEVPETTSDTDSGTEEEDLPEALGTHDGEDEDDGEDHESGSDSESDYSHHSEEPSDEEFEEILS